MKTVQCKNTISGSNISGIVVKFLCTRVLSKCPQKRQEKHLNRKQGGTDIKNTCSKWIIQCIHIKHSISENLCGMVGQYSTCNFIF